MFIIPEETLDKLICTVCSNYLSVYPVKVYARKIIKCGRCCEKDDNGVVSLYNNIIETSLFPCVNRYEGCNQLMHYLEVAAHERVCYSRTYKCPICPSGNEYTSFQLLQHYKSSHVNEILEKPEIFTNGKQEFENYYMYKENNYLFIIYFRCNLSEKCFLFNVSSLGPKERVESIRQYIRYYINNKNGSKRLCLQTKKRRCSIFGNKVDSFKITFPNQMNSVSLNFCLDICTTFNYIKSNIFTTNKPENIGLNNKYPKIYLSAKFKRQNPEYYLSPNHTKIYKNEVFPRICQFCENIFQILGSFKIFKCVCNHFYCSTCYAISPYCLRNCKLEPFGTSHCNLLRFYCRWNCGTFYHGENVINHEDCCKKNVDRQYTLKYLAEKHFISYVSNDPTHFVTRSNVFYPCDLQCGSKGKHIFVITRDNFKFYLHSAYQNGNYNISISHNYPSDKYEFFLKTKDSYNSEYCHGETYSIQRNFDDILALTVLMKQK